MKCPKCQADSPEGAKFCTSCGEKLTVDSNPANPKQDVSEKPIKRPEGDSTKKFLEREPPEKWRNADRIVEQFIGGDSVWTGNRYTSYQYFFSNPSDSSPDKLTENIPYRKISVEDLAQMTNPFVAPKNNTEIRNILKKYRFIFLSGNSGVGKYHAALYLLHTVCQCQNVIEIGASVEYRQLKTLQFAEKTGYVIDTCDLNMLKQWQKDALNQFKLDDKNSYLIITVDRSLETRLDDFKAYWVVFQPPSAVDILEAHLQQLLGGQPDQLAAARVAQNTPSIKNLMPGLKPRDAVHLARLLQDVVLGKMQVEDVPNQFEGYALNNIKIWFEKHPEMADRAFLLAVAVYHQSKYQNVLDASDLLLKRLQPVPPKPSDTPEPPPPNPFAVPKSVRLQMVDAHLVDNFQDAAYGRVSTEVIVLDSPIWQRLVLQYVWDEYDQFRNTFLEWLDDLCRLGHDPTLYQSAAAALGMLSRLNFDWFAKQIFERWANIELYDALAAALKVASAEPRIRSQVLALLKHWSAQTDSPASLAATVVWGYLGERFLPEALSSLQLMIQQCQNSNYQPIFHNAFLLILEKFDANDDCWLQVLETWFVWTKKRDESTLSVGVDSFLISAFYLRLSKSMPEADAGLPVLLFLMKSNAPVPARILTLWRRALAVSEDDAIYVLRHWAGIISEKRNLVGEFIKFFDNLIDGSQRRRQQLAFHFNRWANEPEQPLEIAEQLWQYFKQE